MKVLTNVLLLSVGFTLGYLAKKNGFGEIICNKIKRCCLKKVANNIEETIKEEKEKEKEEEKKEEKKEEYNKLIKKIIQENDYDDVAMQEEIDDCIDYLSAEEFGDKFMQTDELDDVPILKYCYIRKKDPGDIIIINENDEQVSEVEYDNRILSLHEAFGSSFIQELERNLSEQDNTLIILNNYFGFFVTLSDWTDGMEDDKYET